jgi:tetratricopeptide (TPR) repeat protein
MKTHPFRYLVPLALGAVLWSSAARARLFVEAIVQGNPQRVEAQRIAAKPNGDLVIYREGVDPVTLPKGQYVRAVGAKPAEIDQATALMAEGKDEQAAQLLRQAMRKSRYLSWDARAGAMLVDLQLENDDSAAASATLRQLRQTYGDKLLELYPEVQLADWKVRIATGSVAGLQEDLTRAIQNPETPRAKRAMAQMVRGDLKTRREEFRSAVLDYLRTAYFFPDVGEVHAEALYKTATTFARLGDAVRSRKYGEMLKETHPDSTFAAKPIGN